MPGLSAFNPEGTSNPLPAFVGKRFFYETIDALNSIKAYTPSRKKPAGLSINALQVRLAMMSAGDPHHYAVLKHDWNR